MPSLRPPSITKHHLPCGQIMELEYCPLYDTYTSYGILFRLPYYESLPDKITIPANKTNYVLIRTSKPITSILGSVSYKVTISFASKNNKQL